MENQDKTSITVETTINAPMDKVWEYWTKPEHITHWSNASDDWHTPHVKNDLRSGGSFLSRMAAKDGSVTFDFTGVYDVVTDHEEINYTITDGRKVKINFSGDDGAIKITESFEAESTHPMEMQKAGWQAILDNFKKYTESN